MLVVEGVRVAYGEDVVIDGLDWRPGAGIDGAATAVTALLGPSGCGKSTLLRAIAGLEKPSAGRITFGGRDLADLPTHRRDFGVVFQDGQLFPGRTVAANVGYGLRMRGWSRSAIRDRVAEVLELVSLPDLADRPADELSGGQAQRVALARALAPRPRLLLLDEPLAALDRRLRDRLAADIAHIVRESGTPTILVTHDHTEAAVMADDVSVMRDGAIVQSAAPMMLWRNPVDEWTARFLGCTTVIAAESVGGVAPTSFGEIVTGRADGIVHLGFRPESLRAGAVPDEGVDPARDRSSSVGVVARVAVLPSGPRVYVEPDVVGVGLGTSGADAGAPDVHGVDAIGDEGVAVGDRVAVTAIPERVAVIGP
ncbi:ABC transporter ATP-binding protein [Gordonia soli]|uniref:ABC-type quaternary amine transporter n=1 Tax=Gordonia soli NBRC 108243 TaxID=1223545 RepID=M0QGD1_9ACTN|nr:ABC transporter ATP-binding protein [Gordonia soli]GAC66447.1 putative ABC transporter ATP-binding protein [Gordonia soli NBRC 108243]